LYRERNKDINFHPVAKSPANRRMGGSWFFRSIKKEALFDSGITGGEWNIYCKPAPEIRRVNYYRNDHKPMLEPNLGPFV